MADDVDTDMSDAVDEFSPRYDDDYGSESRDSSSNDSTSRAQTPERGSNAPGDVDRTPRASDFPSYVPRSDPASSSSRRSPTIGGSRDGDSDILMGEPVP